MGRLTRDGTAQLSRETEFSGVNGDKEIFPWSADHVNRISNLPVDLYSATWYTYAMTTKRVSTAVVVQYFVFEHTLYRSGCGKNIWMPPWTSGAIPRVSTRFSLSVENEQAETRRDGQICLAKPNFQA